MTPRFESQLGLSCFITLDPVFIAVSTGIIEHEVVILCSYESTFEVSDLNSLTLSQGCTLHANR